MPKADDYQPLELVKSTSQRKYTLAEIKQLTAEWLAEQDDEMLQWTFSIWLEWLKKREIGSAR